jgi:uncharacterized membrane protein YgcG
MKGIFGSRFKLGSTLAIMLIFGLGLYFLRSQFFPSRRPAERLAVQEPAPGILFQDEFTNPDSGWPSGGEGKASFGYQAPTFYFLELNTADEVLTIFRGLNLADFVAETAAIVNYTGTSKGNFRYGLAIRRSDEQYYAFIISPRTRSWQVYKHTSDGVELLAEDKHDTIQGTFQLYSLDITARGASFSFQINDQPVVELTDPDYASGDVGFIVETLDENEVHVAYDGLVIREIEEQPVAAVLTATVTSPTPPPSPTPTAIPVLTLPTLNPTPSPTPTLTPLRRSLPPTATPILPTSTPSPSPTATPEPPTPTSSPTPSPIPTATFAPPTPSPTAAATPTPSIPSGVFVLLKPLDLNQPSYGPTDFEWIWSGAVPAGLGFEVRIWREGEPVVGAHDAVADNQSGHIQNIGENKYRINFDVSGSAGLQGRSGEYLWTVALVQISPNYADLGQQASPARFRFEASSSGGNGGGNGNSGGNGGGGSSGGGVGVD